MNEENQTEGQQPPAAPAESPVPKTSGMAIASLVLAFLCAPIGLILGIIALVQIGRNPHALRGYGMALAGTIIGAIATVLLPIIMMLAAIAIPNFIHARETAQQTTCITNVKELSLAAHMYAADHSDAYPAAATWNESLKPYLKNPDAFICPVVKSKEPSYAINGQLSGFRVRDVQMAAETVMLYESIPGKNQAGGPELLPSPPRHMNRNNTIGFVDGHVKSMDRVGTGGLNWDPKAVEEYKTLY